MSNIEDHTVIDVILNMSCSFCLGYIATQHGSNIPLQKQLEHANQQSGFNEEKYKLQQVCVHVCFR